MMISLALKSFKLRPDDVVARLTTSGLTSAFFVSDYETRAEFAFLLLQLPLTRAAHSVPPLSTHCRRGVTASAAAAAAFMCIMKHSSSSVSSLARRRSLELL